MFFLFFYQIVLTTGKGLSEEAKNVAKRIDHVLLTPENPRGLFDFLTGTLKMPVAWAYREYEGFASGGVFFGNVNLEALVMNQSDLSSPCNISGIAFEPEESTEQAVEELKRRQIAFEEPQTYEFGQGQSKMKMWTTTMLKDFFPGAVVFLCEYHPGIFNPPAWKKTLQKTLKKIEGGPLGIEYVLEMEIRVTDKEKALEKWRHFLSPHATSSSGCFTIGDGPRLRFRESDKNMIHPIRIKVKSLDKAREFLLTQGLLGKDEGQSIKLDVNKTFGILFEILESEYQPE